MIYGLFLLRVYPIWMSTIFKMIVIDRDGLYNKLNRNRKINYKFFIRVIKIFLNNLDCFFIK